MHGDEQQGFRSNAGNGNVRRVLLLREATVNVVELVVHQRCEVKLVEVFDQTRAKAKSELIEKQRTKQNRKLESGLYHHQLQYKW